MLFLSDIYNSNLPQDKRSGQFRPDLEVQGLFILFLFLIFGFFLGLSLGLLLFLIGSFLLGSILLGKGLFRLFRLFSLSRLFSFVGGLF